MKKIFITILVYLIISVKLDAQYKPDFLINDDTTSYTKNSGKLGIDAEGNFVVIWNDGRNSIPNYPKYNVFMQRYNKYGVPLGNNVQVNNLILDYVYKSSVVRKQISRYIVSWLDNYTVCKIRTKVYSSSGDSLSTTITLPTLDNQSINEFAISGNEKGKYVIAFSRTSGLTYSRICYQLIDSVGNLIGAIRRAGDIDTNYLVESSPSVNVLSNNNFVITWKDNRINAGCIFMQMFDSLGNKIGNNIKVNDDTSSTAQDFNPKISSDTANNFVISFGYIPDPYLDGWVMYQRFDKNGNKLGGNIPVYAGYGNNIACISKRKNGDFAIGMFVSVSSWLTLAYFQRVGNNGLAIGSSKLVSPQYIQYAQNYQDIAINGDKMINLWYDYRQPNPGMYCNILSFQNPDSVVSIRTISEVLPLTYKLEQNYPNPFNQSSIIKFQCSMTGAVQIKIYDILGKEIKTLVNEVLKPGVYEIMFDGKNLPSGVYFYKIQTETFSETRRMLMIK